MRAEVKRNFLKGTRDFAESVVRRYVNQDDNALQANIGSGVKTPEPMVTRIVSCFALSQSCFNEDSRGAFAPLHPH